MFICTELIEETRRPPGQIFGLARRGSSLGPNSHLSRSYDTPITELYIYIYIYSSVRLIAIALLASYF